MYALTYVLNDTGSYVLAGGVNNEYSAGMLAVIDERQPPATSPQSPGSAYVCDNCPEGLAHRYFLFYRQEHEDTALKDHAAPVGLDCSENCSDYLLRLSAMD